MSAFHHFTSEEDYVSVPSLPSLRAKLLKVLRCNDVKANRLLDVGCGDGSLTVEVAKLIKANEVYGIDCASKALEIATKRGIKTARVDLNSERFPFPDDYFDVALAIEVLEHLTNTDHMLNETRRVLKKGGLLVLSTPNLCSYVNRILVMLGYLPFNYEVSQKWRVGKPIRNKMPYNAVGHLRLYNLRALKDHLEVSGFKLVRAYGASIIQYNKVAKAVDRFFEHIPSLASDIIVLSKRVR